MLPRPSLRTAAALVAITALLIVTLVTPALAGWRRQTCRMGTDVRRLIRCAVHHFPVDGGYTKALAVAQCESGLDADAYYAGNAGVFQQRLLYWPPRKAAYNRAVGDRVEASGGVYHARTNVLVSVRYAHLYGWSAWSCS